MSPALREPSKVGERSGGVVVSDAQPSSVTDLAKSASSQNAKIVSSETKSVTHENKKIQIFASKSQILPSKDDYLKMGVNPKFFLFPYKDDGRETMYFSFQS